MAGLLGWLTGAAPGKEYTAEELYATVGEGKMYVALNGKVYDVDPRPDMCVLQPRKRSTARAPARSLSLTPPLAHDTGTGRARRTTSYLGATPPGRSRRWGTTR